MAVTPLHPVAAQLHTVQAELGSFFKERGACIQAMVLTVLVGEHCFILGSPGTGKTYLVTCFINRFTGAITFEQSLAKDMPAEAVIGPWDIPKLRTHGDFQRKFNGFLPTAHLAMLDEIGKMSPTLGHNLLSLLNERKLFQVNGTRSSIDVPLSSVFGGSNEMPTTESDDAAALFDRLLVRVVVEPIKETGNFASFLNAGTPGAGTQIDWADMQDVIKNVVPAVTIPTDVLEVVATLRTTLRGHSIVPSDRRWKASMKLLKANAFLNGRTEATTDDIEVLRHTLWDVPTEIPLVERLTLSVSNPIAEKALSVLEQAEEIATEVRDSKALALDKRAAIGSALHGRLKVISTDLAKVRQEALSAGASLTKVDEVGDRVSAIKASIYEDLLGLDIASLR